MKNREVEVAISSGMIDSRREGFCDVSPAGRPRSAERGIETLVGPIWFARLRPQPSAVVCRPGSSGGRIAATQRRLGGADATARVRRHPGTMTGAWL